MCCTGASCDATSATEATVRSRVMLVVVDRTGPVEAAAARTSLDVLVIEMVASGVHDRTVR